MRLVFFDLDRTLLEVNSASGWVKRELSKGEISWTVGVKAAWWLLRYRLGAAEMEGALKEGALTLTGRSEKELAAAVR